MKFKSLIFVMILVAGLLSATIFPSCNQPGKSMAAGDTLKGKITISGAFALYPLVVKCAEVFQKLHPQVTINVSAGGAGKGMTDALNKMVDLGMYSKAVSPEEQARGAWWIAIAKDAVLPTINAGNPVLADLKAKGLTQQKFYDIFISGNIKTWGQAVGNNSKVDLQVFTRSDACGAADMWAKYLNNKKQEDMQTRKIDPGLAVIPIDINGNGKIDPEENFYDNIDMVMKAINDGRYPSPPARDLYLVSGGKPTNKLVLNFLQWLLSDGQKFVNEAGYVTIKPEQVTSELQKLK